MNYCPLLQRAKAGNQLREHRVQVRGVVPAYQSRRECPLRAQHASLRGWWQSGPGSQRSAVWPAGRPPWCLLGAGTVALPGPQAPPRWSWLRGCSFWRPHLSCVPSKDPASPACSMFSVNGPGVAGGWGRHQEPGGGLPCPEIPEPRWVPMGSCPGSQEGPVLWRGGAAAGSAAPSGYPVTAWGTGLSPGLRPLRL